MSLIIFDYDGVLADTLADMLHFAQAICDKLNIAHTVRQSDLSELEIMSFATFGRACEAPEILIDEFVRGCVEKFAAKESPPEIFEGLSEVINELQQEHTLAIVTGNTTTNVNAFLVKHGLNHCFRAVYGVDQPGSKVEKILRAQKQFSAENEAIFMVGDSASDIHAAREAGVKSIAVSWGHQSIELLQKANPDFFVHAPGEIPIVIENARGYLRL